jgi:hypothetical protein
MDSKRPLLYSVRSWSLSLRKLCIGIDEQCYAGMINKERFCNDYIYYHSVFYTQTVVKY